MKVLNNVFLFKMYSIESDYDREIYIGHTNHILDYSITTYLRNT